MTYENIISTYSNYFYIDEASMKLGVRAMANLVIDYFELHVRP